MRRSNPIRCVSCFGPVSWNFPPLTESIDEWPRPGRAWGAPDVLVVQVDRRSGSPLGPGRRVEVRAVIDSVKVTCPHCGKRGPFEGHLRGHEVECRHCNRPFFIADYIRVPCPKCFNGLKIRPCLLGEMVSCRHCTHQFFVQLAPDLANVLPASQATPPPGDSPVEFGVFDPAKKVLEDEVRRMRERLESGVVEVTSSTQELREVRGLLTESERQVQELRAQLQQTQDGESLEVLRREHVEAMAQVAQIADERDRHAARAAELEAALHELEHRHQAERDRMARELDLARRGKDVVAAVDDRGSGSSDAIRGLSGSTMDQASRRDPTQRTANRTRSGARDSRSAPAGMPGLEPEGVGSTDEVPADVASRLAELQDRLRATASRLTQPKI